MNRCYEIEDLNFGVKSRAKRETRDVWVTVVKNILSASDLRARQESTGHMLHFSAM